MPAADLSQDFPARLRVLRAFAMLFGLAIGFERELDNHPAGIPTRRLIGVAVPLLAWFGDAVGVEVSGMDYRHVARGDSISIVEVLGFLGAGMIFCSELSAAVP